MIGTGRQPTGHLLHQCYRLLHTVGQGGMGAVYVAQDTQLGDRPVAVKEMSMSRLAPQDLLQAVEQFRREAHLLASLHHPSLPVIHEYFREDDRWYLVMSFIEGQNLQATLNAAPGNRLPVNDVVRIGIELCEVLEYLHTHDPQVIFRDLKPLNIMLTPKGHICLIDFGIARHFKQEQTKDTAYYYSVGYAPPEQYGQSQTDPRSDIYSLGATLHQMLSGHNPASKPFQFPNLQLVDPTIPVPLAMLIAQMLEMSEQARPANVAEVRDRLEKVHELGQIEPTKKAVTEEKVQFLTKPVSSAQQATSASARYDLWSQIDRFLNKRRRLAWICFITLILVVGLRTDFFIYHDPDMVGSNGDYGTLALSVSSMGAILVGLVFLLTKKRPLIDAIGGSALTAFGSLVLLTFLSGTVALCFEGPNAYANFSYYSQNCFPFQTPVLPYPVPILFLSILMLSVGTYLFLRSVNAMGGFIFGAILILEIFLQRALLYSYSETGILNPGSYSAPIPIILSLIWFPSVILGCIAIIVTLLKILRSKKQVLVN